jgi:hypothetical protein
MRFFLATAVALAAFVALPGTASAAWVWPLRGDVITPYRNVDDPYAGGQHRGIDIAGPVGARVVAAAGGEVRFAGTAGSSGLTVSIRTTDGFDTSYLHLSSVSVREGEAVSSGDELGAVGTTGSRSASEPHLHFGVREAGTRHAYRNPLDFLPPPEAPPAPDSPRAAPSPTPVPTPLAPAPAPAGDPGRIPTAGPAPRRVPAARRAPRRLPRRVPIGERVPRRVPVGDRMPAPHSVPAPREAPVAAKSPRGVPVHEPESRPAPILNRLPHRLRVGDGEPRRLPLGKHAPPVAAGDDRASQAEEEPAALGPTPGGAPAEHSALGAPPAAGGPASRSKNGAPGPDIGWILACVGLLAAAALLGLTEDGRKASRQGRARLIKLLRPLTGGG